MRATRTAAVMTLVLALATQLAPPRAEIVEEIVAWVNGDIITSSELEREEQAMIAEAYRRFAGDELDARVEQLRKNMLMDIIDRKILLDRARMLFTDMEQIKKVYYEGFRESQSINDDEEFARMLRQEGMTVEQFKERLLELYAPDEVLRIEVKDRISISEAEIDAYYQENPEDFVMPDAVTVREIVLLAKAPADRDERRDEAEAVLQQLRDGADFAEVAGRVSEAGTRDEGGKLGPLGRGDLSKQLEEIAFGLEEGQLSDLIETDYGFHILKCESRQVNQKRSLADVREQLRRYLAERRYSVALQEFLKKAREDAEWCVKAKYRDRLGAETAPSCKNL